MKRLLKALRFPVQMRTERTEKNVTGTVVEGTGPLKGHPMYKIVLNVCTLVILALFSNHVRETVVQGKNFVFAVGYTALLSLELPLCFLYFRTKRAVFGKALGWLLALHVLYPAYLAVSLAVVAPESLSTPYGRACSSSCSLCSPMRRALSGGIGAGPGLPPMGGYGIAYCFS
jgi:hypothetical protein